MDRVLKSAWAGTSEDSTSNRKTFDPTANRSPAPIGQDCTGLSLSLVPERPFADEIDPITMDGLEPHEDVGVHEKNWFDSIRANKKPNADIELAVRAQTVISLAEMSQRLNMTCLFDEKTRKITDGSGKEVKAITYGTLELS